MAEQAKQITVTESRKIIAVNVDVESGMTDVLEKVTLTDADGKIVSRVTTRTTAPTAEAAAWIAQAVEASKKAPTADVPE